MQFSASLTKRADLKTSVASFKPEIRSGTFFDFAVTDGRGHISVQQELLTVKCPSQTKANPLFMDFASILTRLFFLVKLSMENSWKDTFYLKDDVIGESKVRSL